MGPASSLFIRYEVPESGRTLDKHRTMADVLGKLEDQRITKNSRTTDN